MIGLVKSKNDVIIGMFFYDRNHLKKVFSADIGVEPLSQVPDIIENACRRLVRLWRIPSSGGVGCFFACLPSSPEGYAGQVISTENPNFEMTSSHHHRHPPDRRQKFLMNMANS
jgi:hypothetical protein